MRAIFFSLYLLLLSVPANAALHFPTLTGRVVDDAHVLSQGTVQTLTQMLADYENGTTNQIVVVTLPSLQNTTIEDYGYQLGRVWQIGQKDKNNGVLLIIAPNERKVRIEVGYGLEGTLTDAASSEIVHGIMLPKFRSGQMEQGIMDGTGAILSVLGGNALPVHHSAGLTPGISLLIKIIFVILFVFLGGRHPLFFTLLLSNNSSRFGSSRLSGTSWESGFSSGGFSGGGGSFGGGGASGGW